MFVVIMVKSKLSYCDDECDYVNLKCKTMLLNLDKSQYG